MANNKNPFGASFTSISMVTVDKWRYSENARKISRVWHLNSTAFVCRSKKGLNLMQINTNKCKFCFKVIWIVLSFIRAKDLGVNVIKNVLTGQIKLNRTLHLENQFCCCCFVNVNYVCCTDSNNLILLLDAGWILTINTLGLYHVTIENYDPEEMNRIALKQDLYDPRKQQSPPPQ